MINVLRQPLYRFLLVGSLLYGAWYALYETWLRPSTQLDEWVVQRLIQGSTWMLQLFGYEVMDAATCQRANAMGIAGGNCIQIGAPCDGVILFALFFCFIAAFPGPWKKKLWFIPMGLISIHVLNTLRIFGLVLILFYRPEALSFNHDYTFTILVYAFVFGLWYWWAERFSPGKLTARAA